MWDVRSSRCTRELPAHSDPVTGVDYSWDGTMLASASFDGIVRLWDSGTGHCLKTLIDKDNPPLAHARFSPNSARRAGGAGEGGGSGVLPPERCRCCWRAACNLLLAPGPTPRACTAPPAASARTKQRGPGPELLPLRPLHPPPFPAPLPTTPPDP
jgi:hypothetical protein